ncbi:MAG: membrane integrity-associated transporter subunit PqiC [Opitutales bacterium]
MKTATALLLSLTGILLTGCINLEPEPDDTRRFALGPVSQAEARLNKAGGHALYLMPPHLPTYLERNELLYRTGRGEVVALPTARWAEPLADGVARTFAHYLDAQPDIEVAGYYPWPQPAGPSARLTLKFSRFDATEDGRVQSIVFWSLRLPDGSRRAGTLEGKTISWEVGAPESLVAAQNQALEALAESLGEALRGALRP